MQKKRFISMLLAGVLTRSLAARGNSSNGGEGNGNTPNTSGKAVEAEPKGTEDSAGKSVTYWIDPEMGGITNASTFDGHTLILFSPSFKFAKGPAGVSPSHFLPR